MCSSNNGDCSYTYSMLLDVVYYLDANNLVCWAGIGVIVISLVFFKWLESLVDSNRFLIQVNLLQRNGYSVRNWYRFNNLIISLIHSIVSSIWAISSVYLYPKLCWDFVDEFHNYPFLLLSFSGGYFCADLWANFERRLLFNKSAKDSAEIIIHHVLILLDLLIAFGRNKYLGGLIIAILAEVNNIFLHLRSIFILLSIPVGIAGNLWLTHLNVLTSLVFRLIPLCLISYRFTIDLDNQYPDIPLLDYTFVILSIILLFAYKNAMLYRILVRDYKMATN